MCFLLSDEASFMTGGYISLTADTPQCDLSRDRRWATALLRGRLLAQAESLREAEELRACVSGVDAATA